MSLRRILLGLSAVATVLLALEKVGAYQIVPGGDLGFQGEPLSDGARVGLSLRNDVGDLTCWIRVVVRAGGGGQPSFRVATWSGDPLTIVTRALGADRHEVKISKQATAPEGVPFLWRAGLPLELETSAAVPLTLEDWVVFPNNQASDTRAKAVRRWWWTRLSWGFLGFSVLGTLLAVLKEKEERETVTTRTLVRTILISLEGRDPQETKRVRAFLSKVLLEETPVLEALTSARLLGQSTAAKLGFLARATSLFRERIRVVQDELDGYKRRLPS